MAGSRGPERDRATPSGATVRVTEALPSLRRYRRTGFGASQEGINIVRVVVAFVAEVVVASLVFGSTAL